MKKMLRPGFVSSCLAAVSVLFSATGMQAAQPYGQVPSATVKPQRRAAYTPTPPSYAASAQASTTASRSGSLETKVSQLAKNDQRQDQRLHYLERDVRSLKPKGNLPAAPPPYDAAAPSARLHTVRSGETLWRIAARYNTSVNAIRAANRMSGDTVTVGQALMIPGDEAPDSAPISPGVHVVRSGETFSGIASRYRVTQDALAQANPAAYPDRLLIGERLSIPGAKAKTHSIPPLPAAPGLPSLAGSESRKTHTVRSGESLGAIARKYGISTASLATANKLKNPNLVEIGQKLVIPAGPARSAPQPPPAGQMLARNDVDLAAPDTIPLPGAGLVALPPPLPAPVQPKASPTPAPAPVSRQASMPFGQHRGVVAYRLEKGDDINTVANVFGTTPANIRELNMLSDTAELKEGQEIVVPALGPVN